MTDIRIGTCGWKYPSWEGLVYSGGAADSYLSQYARVYSSVEIDQWFWALPEPRTVSEYLQAVPDDFRFTIKVPNSITLTHMYKKKGEDEPKPNPDFLSPSLLAEFVSRISPMKEHTGVLMLQFEYLNKKKMASQKEFLGALETFFCARKVNGALSGWTCAIEPRNPNWLNDDYFNFLASRGLGHVFLQGYYMPPVTSIYQTCAGLLTGASVVRLHGPDRQGMEKLTGERWDKIVAPKDRELPGIADMALDMQTRGLVVYLNVNNHYEGSAPLTIGKSRALLEERRPRAAESGLRGSPGSSVAQSGPHEPSGPHGWPPRAKGG
jgi:uncharacterized protein YecE (DUF72 family)